MPDTRTSKEMIAGLYNRAVPIYDQVGPGKFAERVGANHNAV